MVVGFVSRLGWRPGGRAPLVVVRSRTADGGDSDSAVICALVGRNLVYALGHPLVVVWHHVLWGSTINTCLIFDMLVEGCYGCEGDVIG
ncbi:hypothetical protein AAZX31_01G151900 [Glycine max]|uniref:Uncharacterized protein n=1 Tax=Glycine soja TaxID=3848 RepID=A0A445M457_GLYSO|nr:hypothetical protein JHK87_001987 [Glycine soja]KAG5069672.1 hypothetical protein JHK85_002049 [Glycine max]KAG5089382.1 hypothetical protein JHK86_001994 [Glycine max]KHN36017.1 hypothetical protein glysoja_003140 [Glycine soja]RZC30299.1 hypothetical protein D0Y65_001737 [Glycine soja]